MTNPNQFFHDFPSLDVLAPHAEWLDELYKQYQTDPNSVDLSFQALFSGKPWFVEKKGSPLSSAKETSPSSGESFATLGESSMISTFVNVQAIIDSYRRYGHIQAQINPLHEYEKKGQTSFQQELSLDFYQIQSTFLKKRVPQGVLPQATSYEGYTLEEVFKRLKQQYCGTLGFEFMHLENPKERAFWLEKIEEKISALPFSVSHEEKIFIYQRLLAAETFERFLHTKYLGAKRFSLEGGESLIPLLDMLLQAAGEHHRQEVVLGMPHRGRLNVLTHLLGKKPSLIFSEFEDFSPASVIGKSDVKYHMGFSTDHVTKTGKKIHLSLAFNPSHLEIINPVVLGRVRAKQHRLKDKTCDQVLGILIHGDAAFMGQGVVAESLNFSQTQAYHTGGTIHIVVNNQIGFTTATKDSRSSRYSTDIAKMIDAPIIHVNGDHPEAVVKAAWLAEQYQATFHKDVVIDLVCFRKYGHNETDEPSFTQPLMYQEIAKHPSVVSLYGQTLIEQSVVSQQQLNAWQGEVQNQLEIQLEETRNRKERPTVSNLQGVWKSYQGGLFSHIKPENTGVSKEILASLSEKISQTPEGFSVHPKIARLLGQRAAMGKGEQALDFGMGEALAFGSLLWEGTSIRFTGQDVRRGTFSHRQAVLIDTQTGAEYNALQHLVRSSEKQIADFQLYDSTLSEAAVLGFEYGYSLDTPDSLVLWEAQFGDFVNGAQVILDQFLSAAESKWSRLSGLVLLLPHGYEGQGPEHSSARMERFLQLCAEDNIQVAYPSTPAQYFHLLRRQIQSPFRKPLVIFTPKSLLRHPLAKSPLEEFSQGRFQTILPDGRVDKSFVNRIVLCSGKIYYDLLEEQNRRPHQNIALVRLEQLYPIDETAIQAVLKSYSNAKELYLVQEEPANMGTRNFLLPYFLSLKSNLVVKTVSRKEAASPATGSHKAHALEQKELFDQVYQ